MTGHDLRETGYFTLLVLAAAVDDRHGANIEDHPALAGNLRRMLRPFLRAFRGRSRGRLLLGRDTLAAESLDQVRRLGKFSSQGQSLPGHCWFEIDRLPLEIFHVLR